MSFLKNILIIILCFLVADASSQNGIQFMHTDLSVAMAKAKKEDKSIFVDTYAPWCQPCKRMNREFKNKDLATYFNNNFVNLKVNMESEFGKFIHLQYSVVFLPTFLILDKYGNVQIKVDRMISAQELLGIGRQINEGDTFYAASTSRPPVNQTKPVTNKLPQQIENKNAVKKSETKKPEVIAKTSTIKETQVAKNNQGTISEATHSEEKILYVLGDGANPDMLREEAYFRMKLMDGSHIGTARKYLETQPDWGKTENVKFIFDFLYNTGTKEFNFLIDNRALFEKELGKDKIAKTINILIHTKLHQGYPRPTLEEAILLFSYVDPKNAIVSANTYYIERMYSDNKISEFRVLARKYLDKIDPNNHQIKYKWASSFTDDEFKDPVILNQCIQQMESAVSLNAEVYDYFLLLAKLNYRKGVKNRAKAAANKAINIADKKGLDKTEAKLLLRKLERS